MRRFVGTRRSMTEDAEPETLDQSESTDPDEVGLDPLEAGVEPPERWAAADHYGMTPEEQRRGESLDDRLEQEVPDDAGRVEGVPDGPLVEENAEVPQESPPPVHDSPTDNADGASVAESLREPEEP